MEKEPLPETIVNPPSYTEACAPPALYPNLSNQPTSSQAPQVLYSNQANQPTFIVINNDPGKNCPQCGQQNTMEYRDVISTRQHLWALFLCLFVCWPCAWIPYVNNNCMFNQGKCKSCGYKSKDKTNNTGLIAGIVLLIVLIIIVIVVHFTVFNETRKNIEYHHFDHFNKQHQQGFQGNW